MLMQLQCNLKKDCIKNYVLPDSEEKIYTRIYIKKNIIAVDTHK